MERLGWVFWRCWDSAWIADRDACVADLNMTLSRLGIEPIGMGEIDGIFTAHVEVSSPKSDTATLTLDLGVLDAQAPAPRDTAPPWSKKIEGEGCAGTCGGLVGQVRDAEGVA